MLSESVHVHTMLVPGKWSGEGREVKAKLWLLRSNRCRGRSGGTFTSVAISLTYSFESRFFGMLRSRPRPQAISCGHPGSFRPSCRVFPYRTETVVLTQRERPMARCGCGGASRPSYRIQVCG